MAEKNTRIVLGKEIPVRFSFLQAHEPKEYTNEETGEKTMKYSVSVLIPKDSKKDIALINEQVELLMAEHFKGKTANTLKLPLRDGDEEADEKGDAYKGHYFFNCSSKLKPAVVGTEIDEFTNKLKGLGPDEIKSGDYGRISINFFHFVGKQKGIGVGMGNIQKTKDGEALGSQRSADEDFGDLSDGFDD